MMQQQETAAIVMGKVVAGQLQETEDALAIEEPLELSLLEDGLAVTEAKTISITMRTPGHDEDLAAGFLFTEGIIKTPEQVAGIKHLDFDPNRILVTLHAGEVPNLHQAERNFYTTSSCGVCGKTSIDAIRTASPYLQETDQLQVHHSTLYQLQERLREQQAVFNTTGGLHAAALFTEDGRFIALREDVGRHNALDKLIGAALLKKELPLTNTLLLLSGRASFELIQKATMAGIKLVVAVGAPSSLAVQLARDCNLTLAGFLRENRFNIYTHRQRIIL